MKKIIIALCLLISVSVTAQTNKAFSIGPTIGANHSFMSPYSNKFYPTWTAGLAAIYSPGQHWGIGGDLRFSKEGSKVITEQRGYETTEEIEVDYLRVPIRGIYFFGDVEDDLRPKITLGPSFGFLVDEKNTGSATANKFDFGLNSSAGLNYRLVPDLWLNVDANYYHGLTDARDRTTGKEMNRSIGLQVGMLVGF